MRESKSDIAEMSLRVPTPLGRVLVGVLSTAAALIDVLLVRHHCRATNVLGRYSFGFFLFLVCWTALTVCMVTLTYSWRRLNIDLYGQLVSNAYQRAAIFCLNTVLFIVVVNFLLGIAHTIAPDRVFSIVTGYKVKPWSHNFRVRAYEGCNSREVKKTIEEFELLNIRGLEYRPFTGFSQPRFSGELVNVDEDEGSTFRRSSPCYSKHSGSRKPIDVFVFGGSTTFGWGVADKWTYCSYLSRALQERAPKISSRQDVRITNYGQPRYYSSQEILLLMSLLKSGRRPQLVIFMDGLNDGGLFDGRTQSGLFKGRDAPSLTEKVSASFHEAQFGRKIDSADLLRGLAWIPMVNLSNMFSVRLRSKPDRQGLTKHHMMLDPNSLSIEKAVSFTVSNYENNLRIARALGKEYGVRCYFFLQPIPFYDYDPSYYKDFMTVDPRLVGYYRELYRQIKERITSRKIDAIFLGNLFDEYGPRNAFIDDVHYSPDFNRFLAARIASYIDVDTR